MAARTIRELIDETDAWRRWHRANGNRIDAAACAIREQALRDCQSIVDGAVMRCARIADRIGDKDLNSDLINEPTQVALGIELAARAIAADIRALTR